MLKRSGDESRFESEASEMLMQKPPLGTPLDFNNPLNDGLVMHLAMNEGHGDVVRDLSMNGNHGTLNNSAFPPTVASGWNPGQTGVGLNFGGWDDYVDCGNNMSLDVTDEFTLSALINPGSAAEVGYIFAKGIPTTNQRYNVYFSGDSDVLKMFEPATLATSDAVFTEYNSWVRIAVVVNDLDITFYKNGVAAGSNTLAVAMVSNNDNLYIGNRTGGASAGTCFDGYIDQPRVHDRALTAKEVRDYYINPWQVYEQ